MTIDNAKTALDKVISKSRIHLYKPIQIAEILYHHRMDNRLNLLDLESYRAKSKQWRDLISRELLGCVCTSSAKFQDNLFDENAIPPQILNILAKENIRTQGGYSPILESREYDKYSNATLWQNEIH